MSTPKPTLWGLLSDTFHVIKSHLLHFLSLAVLFLFPQAITLIIYLFFLHQAYPPPNLSRSIFATPSSELQNETSPPDNLPLLLLIPLLFVFTICATASISYSTLNGFYGKPVKLISSLKAILVSFLPLLSTILILQLFYLLISLAFVVLAFSAYKGLSLMGFVMDYDSGYFLVFVILLTALLLLVLIYFRVKWCLSMVVVLAESKWGLQPLKRSSYLVKGMRRVVLPMILVLWTASLLLSLGFYRVLAPSAGGISWSFVALATVYAAVGTLLSLYSLAACAVLFAYCKAWHGEVALEVDEESGMGYARLSLDEGKGYTLM